MNKELIEKVIIKLEQPLPNEVEYLRDLLNWEKRSSEVNFFIGKRKVNHG